MDTRMFVGLDLGQVSDYSALVIMERPVWHPRTLHDPKPVYAVRHLYRFPLGTSYPDVVQEMYRLLSQPELRDCVFTVDQTGVGRAVVDLISHELGNKVTCLFAPITITAGHAVASGNGTGYHVPKKELVSTVQVLLQARRLQIASGLEHAETLVRELQNFKVKITLARNETFEAWREGVHDDLVLSLALAAWCGERALVGEGRRG